MGRGVLQSGATKKQRRILKGRRRNQTIKKERGALERAEEP